jgi:hypothetical protein
MSQLSARLRLRSLFAEPADLFIGSAPPSRRNGAEIAVTDLAELVN